MINPDVPVVLLEPGLKEGTGLSNTDLPTLAGDVPGLKTPPASTVSVGRSILHKVGIPQRPGSRSTTSKSGFIIHREVSCRHSRIREHHQHIRLYHSEKSAVANHNINLGHCIQFHDTSILAKKSKCMECIIREATEIELNPENRSREEGFFLSK
jgi:hypothetical protein